MKIKILKNKDTDRLIIVNSEQLMKYIYSGDLEWRESDIVLDLYHRDWFYQYNGFTYFKPPVAVTQGTTWPPSLK